MVSNARLDLPEPDSPVTTMRRSRGISTVMFLRLCTRAPCTATVVRAAALGAPLVSPLGCGAAARAAFFRFFLTAELVAILWFPRGKEGQFLHVHVALLGEADRSGGLADEALVGEVLASRGHAAHVEVSFEVVLDLAARPRFAHFAQMVHDRPEQRLG